MSTRLQDFHDSEYHRPDSIPTTQDSAIAAGASVRSRRNVFVFGTFVFTLGTLLILFNSPYRNDFLAPGPLSSVHANLLNGQGADRCAACHDAGNFSVIDWVKDTVSGGKHITECQSDLCMKCHDKTIAPEFALNPHGMNPAQLASYTKKTRSSGFDSRMIFNAPVNDEGEIACSACHREHQGMQINLSAMTDRQCQSCHQDTFHSFETDHPEFTRWPQQRRDRIAFDHVTHSGKHFPGKNTNFDCAQCHVDDNYQNVKLLASYEQTCASCHNQQVVDSSESGMKLFSLPMIDTDAIAQAKLSVGQWPETATGDFDGPLPPLMRLLLSSDQKASMLLEKLGVEFEFSDIDPDDPEQVKAGVQLVWHIKELLYELSLSGSDAIRERLSTTTGRSVSREEVEMLTQGLDAVVFQDAAMRWLPDLNTEVPLRRQGRDNRSISWIPTEQDVLFQVAVDEDELAPNPLKGLLKKAEPQAPSKPVVRTANPLPEPQVGTNRPQESTKPNKVVNRYLENENNPDVLAQNPLKKLMGAGGAAQNSDSIPKENPNPQVVSGSEGEPQPPNGVIEENPLDEALNLETLVDVSTPKILPVNANSGWFRDDLSLSITYRPIGHADQFLVSWTDFASSVSNADCRHEIQPLFEKLTSPINGVGLCSSCHTVDRQNDLSFVTNWKAEYRNPAIREFTKFSHAPHLVLQECSDCHVMDATMDKTEQFLGFDGGLIKSNFLPITKTSCVKCHAEGQAESGCTTCHNYHVGAAALLASPAAIKED